jgi:hypothetical protein
VRVPGLSGLFVSVKELMQERGEAQGNETTKESD